MKENNIIDIKKKTHFNLNSTLLIQESVFLSTILKGGYLETYSITPIVSIDDIKIKSKDDIFKIYPKKKIYNQLFVLSRIYLYVNNKENYLSFYFDGFPWSYQLPNIPEESLQKIDKIYDEPQLGDCIEDDYRQIFDQLSRMIEILLNKGHQLKAFIRWSAISSLNPHIK